MAPGDPGVEVRAGRREPVVYTKVRPDVVVEVDADVCWEQDRWRHAVAFRRARLDLRADDVAAGLPA